MRPVLKFYKNRDSSDPIGCSTGHRLGYQIGHPAGNPLDNRPDIPLDIPRVYLNDCGLDRTSDYSVD
jgi:hypothetical protein